MDLPRHLPQQTVTGILAAALVEHTLGKMIIICLSSKFALLLQAVLVQPFILLKFGTASARALSGYHIGNESFHSCDQFFFLCVVV